LRNDPAAQAAFADLALDAAVVAAYGLILPPAMLAAPRLGCLNIHASLLPRWRGAAPIQAAVLAGDAETGITIMQMDEGLDTGPMLLREAVPIGPQTTAASLHNALAEIGGRLILCALAEAPPPMPQPEAGTSYAPKLTREDGRLDWSLDAAVLDRQVRAFDPWPGTFTLLDGAVLKVLAVRPVAWAFDGAMGAEDPGVPGVPPAPGTVLDAALTVACGSAALRLMRVQLQGRGAMDAEAFLRGHRVAIGTVLGS
jgi:methionyl-tRNA formyltransferase